MNDKISDNDKDSDNDKYSDDSTDSDSIVYNNCSVISLYGCLFILVVNVCQWPTSKITKLLHDFELFYRKMLIYFSTTCR